MGYKLRSRNFGFFLSTDRLRDVTLEDVEIDPEFDSPARTCPQVGFPDK